MSGEERFFMFIGFLVGLITPWVIKNSILGRLFKKLFERKKDE
ncbi:MAG: hypothetical protein AABY22_35520 [Nanoarchaeota archaeon]